MAGEQLVVLGDDKQLQTVDKVIPAINEDVASPGLIEVLDLVSASLTTEKLIELNRQTDIERKTPANVAKEFAESEGILGKLYTEQGDKCIVVGAANFSENQTLAHLYAAALNAAGFRTSVKTV